MALWSLFVSVDGNLYSTQHAAPSPRKAIHRLLHDDGLAQFIKSSKDEAWPTQFSPRDIVLLAPMNPLVNMYVCQFGRAGKYVSVVLARTVSRK